METNSLSEKTSSARKCDILVVDVDGTLVKTDLLWESIISCFLINPFNLLISLIFLFKGRAAFKAFLYDSSRVDCDLLPYNQSVLCLIDEWTSGGGKVYLASGSDVRFLQEIHNLLPGRFVGVFGSNGKHNLTGSCKRDFLNKTFGYKGYAYVGNSYSDIKIWKAASISFMIRRPIFYWIFKSKIPSDTNFIFDRKVNSFSALKALRPHQWSKNIFILLPVILSPEFNGEIIYTSLIAMFLFSVVASSVYLTNDVIDLKYDRSHPEKSKRPMACGDVSIPTALTYASILLVISFAFSQYLPVVFSYLLFVYIISSLFYSTLLKGILVVDIIFVSFFYCLRIVVGFFVSGIAISQWLLIFSFFFFLALVTVKRVADLKIQPGIAVNESGRGYIYDDVQILIPVQVCAGMLSVFAFALYLNDPGVMATFNNIFWMWGGLGILVYWLLRVFVISARGQLPSDPVVFALTDRVSLACGVSLFALFFIARYA